MISIIDGTWRGDFTPQETIVFTLCREMKCSPKALREEFSPYELRFFWDFLQEVWSHEKQEMEDAKRKRQ